MNNVLPVYPRDLIDGARVNTQHKFKCGNSQRFSVSKKKEATFWCLLDSTKASAKFVGDEFCEGTFSDSLIF